MARVPFGVVCKNPLCKKVIILGDMTVADSDAKQLHSGDRAMWLVFTPGTTLKCPKCGKTYEYSPYDLVVFPDAMEQDEKAKEAT